jgi:hypothetical protein
MFCPSATLDNITYPFTKWRSEEESQEWESEEGTALIRGHNVRPNTAKKNQNNTLTRRFLVKRISIYGVSEWVG